MSMQRKSTVKAKRAAVFAALQTDIRYQRVMRLMENLGSMWNIADARGEPQAAALGRRHLRAARRLGQMEDAALRAAGLTP